MVSINKLYNNSANLIFLIYFPLTFFVWYSIIYGGFFSGATSLLVFLTISFFVLFFSRQKIDFNFKLVLLFLSYCLTFVVAHYVFFGDFVDLYGRSLLTFHLHNLLMLFVSYVIGRNFLEINLNSRIFTLIFVFMLLRVLFSADLSILTLNLDFVDEDLRGGYLVLSDIFCIYSLLLVGRLNKIWLKLFIALASIIPLFILNSRTSLYLYIFSVTLYFLIFFKFYKILVIILVLAGILSLFSLKIQNIFIENNRMFSLLSSDGQDASSLERSLLKEIGLKQIENNWFLGDYGGTITISNNLGTYIHGILSYWQNYGLVAFLFVLYFFVYQMVKSSYISLKFKKKAEYNYIFLLSVYFVIVILFARAYVWYFSWFFLGVVHNYFMIVKGQR